MRKALFMAAAMAWITPVFAQSHDFLTADEVDQVREAQDPNERLPLYIRFARIRLDQSQQVVAEQKPGRAVLIHDLVGEYNKIIDAIDTVADDALGRKVDIAVGMKAVAEGEKQFLPALEKIRDSNPADLGRYQFLLTQAIESTKDSLDTSTGDLGARQADIIARDKKEKQERDQVLTPKELEAKKAQEAKAASEAKKHKKPTLLKPGETVKQQP